MVIIKQICTNNITVDFNQTMKGWTTGGMWICAGQRVIETTQTGSFGYKCDIKKAGFDHRCACCSSLGFNVNLIAVDVFCCRVLVQRLLLVFPWIIIVVTGALRFGGPLLRVLYNSLVFINLKEKQQNKWEGNVTQMRIHVNISVPTCSHDILTCRLAGIMFTIFTVLV